MARHSRAAPERAPSIHAKVDITNMLNAVIRLFVDKHKDYVNELLDQEIHRDV